MQKHVLSRKSAGPERSAAFFARLGCLLALLLSSTGAGAQVIKTIPGVAPAGYPDFTTAINDINSSFINGGVTVNVAAGYAEAPTTALPLLTAQGTGGTTGQIIFQKDPNTSGANPKVTAAWAGGTTTRDAVFRLNGADYVTFDGIDVADLTSHVDQTPAMEAGFMLFRPNGTNGCQNNTIRNCVITMNRSNLTAPVSTGVPYGIYGTDNTSASTTLVPVTSAAGTNSNNRFYGNTILNTEAGIYLMGYADATAPYSFLDQNNDVGGTSAATGNTIQNFGGIGTVNVYGVRMNNQNGGNVSYNTIDNSANGGVVSPGTFYGVQFINTNNTTTTNASGTANNNTITISQGENNSTVEGVEMALVGTATTTINNNTVNFSLTTATAGVNNSTRIFLRNNGATGALSMNGNTVNCSLGIGINGSDLTGGAYGVRNTSAVTGNVSLSNNTVAITLANAGSGTLNSAYMAVSNTAVLPANLAFDNNIITYTLTNTGAGTLSPTCHIIFNGGTVGGSLSISGNSISQTMPASPASNGIVSGAWLHIFNAVGVGSNLTLNNNTSTFTLANGGAAFDGSKTSIVNQGGTVGGTASFNGNACNFVLTNAAGASTYSLSGIVNSSTLTGAATMSNNVFTYTGTTSGGSLNVPFTGISNGATASSTLTIDGNTLLNSSTTSTGGITLIAAGAPTTGLLTISNNRYQNSSTASTGTVYFINAGASSNNLTVTGNYFTGFSRSGAGATYGYNASGGAATGGTHQFSSNYFTSITLSGASQFVGIYSLVSNIQNYTVTGNLIGAPVTGVSGQGISTGAANLVGIWAGGAAPVTATFTNNQVQNLTGAGTVVGLTLSGHATAPVTSTSSLLGGSISGNTLSGLSSSGASAAVYGMYLISSTSATAPVNAFANKLNDLNATGAATSSVYGLYVAGGASQAVYNNTVSNLTAPASTSSPAVAGIYLSTGTGATESATYNSVYITGTGTSNSAALYRAGTGPATWRNNLLYNARTGSGGNYAIATASATGFVGSTSIPSSNTSDYNLFFTADPTKVGLYGSTSYSFAGWKTNTNGDGSSMSETTATVPATSLFTNAATGDLSLNAANSAAWYANGTGTQMASIGTDYASTARPTTVAAGAPDIGAFEVTPTLTPPALTASGAPALGGTQTFSLGGRTLAQFTYGSSGTVPTSVVGRYYSGTNPPAPFVAGARYANVYFDFSAIGGSGYTYQPMLGYDPALLGTVVTESAQRISQRNSDNSGYGTFRSTVNPAPARVLVGPGGLGSFSILAISDTDAPLPVELVRFDAVRQGEAVRLSWATASEKNSAYFEVERSTDGTAFVAVGRVAAAGHSTQPQAYAFLDSQLPRSGAALVYYRLRQVDADGTASYSPVRTVALPTAAGLALLPNPTTGAAILTGTAPGMTIHVFDAVGREVATATADPSGTAALVLPQYLPPGVYLVRSGSQTPLRLLFSAAGWSNATQQ